ncbi:DUF4325 domain-containing protein [Ramlibacter henchirensis]|uniref:DUF4325 domain-containing protein n=1 Tax=Ramlibacter henchirensis TaxID=204072 RepID=A0A4Z0BT02_9BURK|nr:DUF4325 domain-containing protein [Ramlibacter henchirensis]TFZ02403.1 DUF4325 domain-containing protein [Ramlibacter henchirensis]
MPRPSRLPREVVAQWTTEHVSSNPDDLTAALARRFGVTRAAAAGAVKQLEAHGYVLRTKGGTRPSFTAGPARWISRRYTLPQADEQLLWERDFLPWMSAAPNILNILHHGFTEIVNNANDHSGGHELQIDFQASAEFIFLGIMDDGVGIFRKIADTLRLPDPRFSLLELSKGKFTSDARQHSGEGIFFTSRMFDAFFLEANQLGYRKFNVGDQEGRLESQDLTLRDHDGQPLGTGVMMFIDADSTRTTRSVFERFTPDAPDDLSFARTVVPVKLASLGNGNLLSRSQAKRLVNRIDQFKVVELDFSGVDEIGQAFADEIFRVFARAHTEVQLVPKNTSSYVDGMIRRVRAA